MNPPRPVAPSRPARPSRAPDRTAPAPVRPFPPVPPADPVTDPPSYTFTKTDRLLFRGEFLRAQKSGRRVRADHFTLVLFDRADGGRVRLGITTTKRAGNAVRRNRLRRLVREVFRLNRGHFPPGFDCVVVAHDQCPDLSFDTARDEILGALARRARAVRSERERERDREARPATGARPSGDTHLAAPPGPSVRPPRENR